MAGAAVAVCMVLGAVADVKAIPIPGLFNTGVDGAGADLPAGSVDPHYALIASDDLYLRAYLGSFGNAALATALCLIIGYPVAYAIARCQYGRRGWSWTRL